MIDRLDRKDWMQLELEGAHREAQREDQANRAHNHAISVHRWPHVQAFIQGLQVSRRRAEVQA